MLLAEPPFEESLYPVSRNVGQIVKHTEAKSAEDYQRTNNYIYLRPSIVASKAIAEQAKARIAKSADGMKDTEKPLLLNISNSAGHIIPHPENADRPNSFDKQRPEKNKNYHITYSTDGACT
ncbi:hypothetical protein ES703_55029 [subsurface metagenome]